jgi:hypothetical protein
MLESELKRIFEKRVRAVFLTKPELIAFMLSHPARPRFFEDVRREIRIGELKAGIRMNRTRVERIIEGATELFCNAAIGAKTKQLMTDSELKAIQTAAGKEKELADWYKEMEKEALSTSVSQSMWKPDGSGKEEPTR